MTDDPYTFSSNVRVPGNCMVKPSALLSYVCRSATFCPVVIAVSTVVGQLFAHPKRKRSPAANARERTFFIFFYD